MTPLRLREASEAARKAALAANTMRSPLADSLGNAETITRECTLFAEAIADGANEIEAATRLLSMVLGFECRVAGVSMPYATHQAYQRAPRATAE